MLELLLSQVRAVIWIATDVVSKLIQTFELAVSFPWLCVDVGVAGTIL
jgi:hypothetical protein